MTKRRAEPMFFPVDLSTFGDQRFGVVATERGEPVQLIWGRFFSAAAQAYKSRCMALSREAIQLAAGLPKRDPWFADQLVDADLAMRTEDGLYRLAGVRDRLQAIEESYAKAVADGRKGAEKRWGANRGANESDGDPIGFDGRVTVTERSTNGECGAARSHSPPPPPSEIQSSSVPTEADTAVLDPVGDDDEASYGMHAVGDDDHLVADVVKRAWLKEFGFADHAIAAWFAQYGKARVLCGLDEAYCDERADPEGFRASPPGQSPRPPKLRVGQKLRRYFENAKPPPGGADVLPLSARKAETAEEAIARAAREMTEKRKREEEREREYMRSGSGD